MNTVLVALVSYALGCVLGAYYIVRLRTGADVRMSGSGNPGARNVLRSGHRKSAIATLLWDAAKGSIAVLIAQSTLPQAWAGGLAFICVVAGHIWPAQLSFRGGKGAATALGCMVFIDPRVTFLAAATGLVAGAATRSFTVGGLSAIAVAPPILALLGAPWTLSTTVAIACAIVLIAHHPVFDRRRQPSVGLNAPPQENPS